MQFTTRPSFHQNCRKTKTRKINSGFLPYFLDSYVPRVLKTQTLPSLRGKSFKGGQQSLPVAEACCLPPSGPPKNSSSPVRDFVWPIPGGTHNGGPGSCHSFLLGDTLSHTGVKNKSLAQAGWRGAAGNVFLTRLFSPLRPRELDSPDLSIL